MATQTLQHSTFEVTLTKGSDITDQVLATISGAIKTVQIKKVFRIAGKTTYNILIIHDDGTPIALELTKRQIAVVEGTDVLDGALATVAGATEAVDIELLEINGTTRIYDVLAVHLNA